MLTSLHPLAAEELNDPTHYVPPWTYNPEEGRGRKSPVTQAQAMEELVSVVKDLQPDKFTPTIITQTSDYLYVEYQSPTFGFIDDVEFWFPKDRCAVHCANMLLLHTSSDSASYHLQQSADSTRSGKLGQLYPCEHMPLRRSEEGCTLPDITP